jgi:signal transduction histidine kinase
MLNLNTCFYSLKACFIVGFIFLIVFSVCAQDQKVADSLAAIYKEGNVRNTDRLDLLWDLSFNEVGDLNLSVKYAEELIYLSQTTGNNLYEHRGYFQKGNKKKKLGDLKEALEAYFKAAETATKAGYLVGQGNTYSAIASVYRVSDNYGSTMLYYHKAIAILRQTDNTVSLATTILNAGDALRKNQEYDSALFYFKESALLFEKANSLTGKAYNLGNAGMVYAALGNNTLAEKNLNEAIQILEELKDYYPICSYLISIADIFVEKNDVRTALSYTERSLQLALNHKLKEQVSEASLKLSQLHEKIGNTEQSLKYYKDHIAYRDSVTNVKTIQKIADQRTQFEVSLKEKEISLLQQAQKLNRIYFIIVIILLALALMVLLFFRQRLANAKLKSTHERKLHDEKIENLLKEQEAHAMQSLIVGREIERKQIAQDLHNHLGSLLATIKVNLNGEKEENMRNHHTITSLVDQACTDIRDMSHSLNMGISEDFGLIPAIKDLALHVQKSGGFEVEFNAAITECQLDSSTEIFIYRIVQELVSNVLKHSQASKVSISLTCFADEHMINIMVHDNGKGFSLKDIEDKNKHDGIGLASIKKMIKQQRGDMHFDSNKQSGTTVSIDLPITNNL